MKKKGGIKFWVWTKKEEKKRSAEPRKKEPNKCRKKDGST